MQRRRNIAVLVGVVLGVLLCVGLAPDRGVPRPSEPAAAATRAPSARQATPGRPVGPRALPREAGKEVAVEVPRRAPAEENVDTAEVPEGVATVTVAVFDPRGTATTRLRRRGCRGIRRYEHTKSGSSRSEFELEVAPGACVLQATRNDGALPAWSESVDLKIVAGEHYDVEMVLPNERTGGLGVAFEADERGMRVNETHADTPAGRLGLAPGDLIVEVDGLPASMLSIGDFQQVMTGPEGTTVRFLVEHPDGDAVEAYTIRRTFLRVDDDGVHGEPMDTGN